MLDYSVQRQKQYKKDKKDLNKMICPTCGKRMRLTRNGKILVCPFCKRAVLLK